ncbi:hypothetical protein AAHC03_022977 [Spirometra sp. Aus1]
MPEIVSIVSLPEEVSRQGSSRIHLKWLKPRLHGDLEQYNITYLSEDKIVGQNSTVDENISLESLNNGNYFVELCAITKANEKSNGGGRGPTNRVGPIAVPSVRTNVTLTYAQIGLGTIRLQWDFSHVKTACGIYSNTIYYNDEYHTYKEVSVPASNQYILKNLAPGLNYTFLVSADCVGSIAAVTKEVQATSEQYPPSAPQNLVVKVTSNSMDVSWSPPASPNGILRAYDVSINNGTTVSKEVEGLNASFADLKPLTTYTVTVRAQTDAGYGSDASIMVTTDPDETQIPSAPKDLNATLQSPTSALITWNKPDEPSPPLTGYLLSFRQQDGNWESVSILGDAVKYLLTGLQPSSTYELQLRASSNFINGKPANTTLSTLVAAPSLPSNIRATQISADEVRITWDPPMSSRAGAEEEEMIVNTFKGGVLQETAKKPISEGAHTVNEIQPDTVMSFTVQVVSPGPLGGFSEIKQLPDLITWRAPMAALKGLDLTATGENSLDASWTENEDKARLLKYEIRVTALDTKKTEIHYTENTSISINNLDTFTEYTVAVAAVGKPNQNGEGSVAGPPFDARVTTWPGRGGIPAELNGSATDTSILLSWEKPQGRPTGIVKHYEVKVKDKTGNGPDEVVHADTHTFTAQSLKPLTMYTVEVRTMNKPAEGTENGGGLGDPAILDVETWPGGSFEPTNGKVELLPPSAIKVSWSPPQGLIGSVEEYRVLLKKGDDVVRSESAPGTTMSLALTGLETGVKYKVYIQAKIAPNSQGKGGRLGPEVFITETSLTESGGGGDVQLTGGLSGGAIAGIVIGVLLAFILLLLLVLVLMRRRNQNVMIEDFQWSEGTGASFFVDDIEMSTFGSDLGSML